MKGVTGAIGEWLPQGMYSQEVSIYWCDSNHRNDRVETIGSREGNSDRILLAHRPLEY